MIIKSILKKLNCKSCTWTPRQKNKKNEETSFSSLHGMWAFIYYLSDNCQHSWAKVNPNRTNRSHCRLADFPHFIYCKWHYCRSVGLSKSSTNNLVWIFDEFSGCGCISGKYTCTGIRKFHPPRSIFSGNGEYSPDNDCKFRRISDWFVSQCFRNEPYENHAKRTKFFVESRCFHIGWRGNGFSGIFHYRILRCNS